MKVAIISDIHDHIDLLNRALQKIQTADVMICCGDLCSPFIMKTLGEKFSRPIHLVFGNNDGDLFRLGKVAGNFPQITLHGEVAELTLDDVRFAITHFDTIGRMLATSDAYDVVCFGHNHQYETSQVGNTMIINPGEVMGELTGTASCVLFDTDDRRVEKILF